MKFNNVLDLGRLAVRNLIGPVMPSGLQQVSIDLYNYQQVKQSLASEKPDMYGNKVAPVLAYKTVKDGSFKVRVFTIHNETVCVVYNKQTFKPEFFMDTKRANAILEPWIKVDALEEMACGFSN